MNVAGLFCTALIVIAAPSTVTLPSAAPRPLACLTRHYPVTATVQDNVWHLVLPNGKRVPFDDQKPKSVEEKLDSPDVQDAFEQRYTPGPIVPVTTQNHDPGRIRITPLLDAVYGHPPAATDIVTVDFMGARLRVHRSIRGPLQNVQVALRAAKAKQPSLSKWLRNFSGAYNPRRIAGTERTSAHAYGIALDLDAKLGDYWRWRAGWRNRMPQAVVDAFEGAGFIWGGRWFHHDTMHFEYRPELLDSDCW